MKKIIIVISFFVSISLYGAFEDSGKDMHAKAMGNAFYAEPGGVSSMQYNPAGTAFTKSLEVLGNFAMPYVGYTTLNMTKFDGALVFPLTYHFHYEKIFKDMNIGLGFNNFSLFYENGKAYSDDNLNYYERLLTINLSKDFKSLLGPETRLAVGGNFDLYFRGLKSNIDTEAMSAYFVNGLSTMGFGMDLGALLYLNSSMIFGVVFDDVVPPNVSFNKDVSKERLKLHTKLGFSWKQPSLWKFKHVTIAGGVGFYNLKSNDWDYHVGFEDWEFNKMLGIRLGYELSDHGMSDLTFGLGWKKAFNSHHNMEINYAFLMPIATLSGTWGTHSISVIYRFVMPKYLFEYKPSARFKLMSGENIEKTNKNTEPVKSMAQGEILTKKQKAEIKRQQKELAKKQKAEEKKRKAEEKKKKAEAKKKAAEQKKNQNKKETKQTSIKEKTNEEQIHVVVSGDNLYAISKKYYGSSKYWQKLAKYNGLKAPNYSFKIGQKLKIPDVSKLK